MAVKYQVIPHIMYHVVRFEDGEPTDSEFGRFKDERRAQSVAATFAAAELGSAANLHTKNPAQAIGAIL